MVELFQAGSLKVYTPTALILSIVIAVPFYRQWETVLLYFYHLGAGIDDPVYGNDITFYMFSFPIYQLIQRELLTIAVLLFAFVLALYWVEHRLLAPQAREYPLGSPNPGAKHDHR